MQSARDYQKIIVDPKRVKETVKYSNNVLACTYDIKEVVSDTTTCLMWQDDNASKTVKKTWQEAIDYCEDMNFAGHDDWRLPNFNELYSIGDRIKSNPAIKDAFENVRSNYYWSSTNYAAYRSGPGAWGIGFNYGHNGYGNKTNGNYIRCVRDGQ